MSEIETERRSPVLVGHIDFGDDNPDELRIKFAPRGVGVLIIGGYQKNQDQDMSVQQIEAALDLAYQQGKQWVSRRSVSLEDHNNRIAQMGQEIASLRAQVKRLRQGLTF